MHLYDRIERELSLQGDLSCPVTGKEWQKGTVLSASELDTLTSGHTGFDSAGQDSKGTSWLEAQKTWVGMIWENRRVWAEMGIPGEEVMGYETHVLFQTPLSSRQTPKSCTSSQHAALATLQLHTLMQPLSLHGEQENGVLSKPQGSPMSRE